jgi:hypothetical protein
VSSANLTLEEYCKAAQIVQMAGFQKNWLTDNETETEESIEEAYYLSREIRDFLENIVDTDGFVTGQDAINYTEELVETLSWLEEIEGEVEMSIEDRSTVFLSSLSEPILQQTVREVGDIEVARFYAPFYGTSNVLQNIADSIDPDRLELIVESESTALDTVDLDEVLDGHNFTVREMRHDSSRWVHAKFLMLEGEWGSACLHGSPNMTGRALMRSSSTGNVESALLTVTPSSESNSLQEAVFSSQDFEFDVSEPVADIKSLELRSTSYEDWESVDADGKDDAEVRLEDARLTQPDSDGNSELILRLDCVDGRADEHGITVRTDGGDEKSIEDSVKDDPEVSVIISEEELPVWRKAVVTVEIPELGVTNPRRVVMETQAYYREFREIVKSKGTQSSNTLLREVLENPDTAVMSAFDIALSEIQKKSMEFKSKEKEPEENDDDMRKTFEERTATNITGGKSQTPSIDNLIEKHLAYHRDRALDSLNLEDTPLPEDVEACIEHSRTFWETIELCYLLERNGEMDTSQIDMEGLFEACEDEISDWMSELDTLVRRVTSVIDQIENNNTVQEDFVDDGGEVEDLDFWGSIFEVILLHPGVVLEFSQRSKFGVYPGKNTLANRIHSSLELVHPHVEQHLYREVYLVERVDTLLSNLTVELGDKESETSISGDGIRALVFNTFLQEIAHKHNFIQNLKRHPTYTEEDLRELGAFSLNGRDAAVSYEVVSQLTLSVVLKEEIEQIKKLQHGTVQET